MASPSEEKSENNDLDSLTKSLCIYIADSNLSIKSATSKAMQMLLSAAIKWGQANPSLGIKDAFRRNREKFTEDFISFAQMLKAQQLELIQKFKYVSIQIDAGKLGSDSYIESTIANLFSRLPPIHFKTEKYFGGQEISYTFFLQSLLNEIAANKLEISAIVADNLRVQWSALKRIQKAKLQEQKASFLILPCACHNISLCLNDAMNESPLLNEACNNVIRFSIIFREKSMYSLIEQSCPGYCETRWNCIFDIACWIVNHFLQIDSFFHDPIINEVQCLKENLSFLVKTLYVHAPFVVIMFAPFKTVSKLFETDSQPMCYVFPYVMAALAKGRTITNFSELTIQTYKIIENCFVQRMFHSIAAKFLYLMFAFTPLGRKFEMNVIRGRNELNPIDVENFCLKTFTVNVTSRSEC